MGALIYIIFNGDFSQYVDLKTKGNIPQNLFQFYKGLVIEDPEKRLTIEKFLELNSTVGKYFDDDFIKNCLFLENFSLKEQSEKQQFLA